MNAHINLFSHFFVRTVFFVCSCFRQIFNHHVNFELYWREVVGYWSSVTVPSVLLHPSQSSCLQLLLRAHHLQELHIICQNHVMPYMPTEYASRVNKQCRRFSHRASQPRVQVQEPRMRGQNVVERSRAPWIKMSREDNQMSLPRMRADC